MTSLKMIRILLFTSGILMLVSLAMAAWTHDTIHLALATSFSLPAVTAAFLLRMRKSGIAAGVPSPPEAPPVRNAMSAALFLLPAAALALLYDWQLYALWTPTVIFVLLFLVFMGGYYAARLTRQLRAPRSPSSGP
jgi:hypothetical protein